MPGAGTFPLLVAPAGGSRRTGCRRVRARHGACRSPFYTAGLNFYILGKKIMARQFEPISGCSPQLGDLVDRMLQVKPSCSCCVSARRSHAAGVATVV